MVKITIQYRSILYPVQIVANSWIFTQIKKFLELTYSINSSVPMLMQPLDNDSNANHKYLLQMCKSHIKTLRKVFAVLNPQFLREGRKFAPKHHNNCQSVVKRMQSGKCSKY